MDRAIPATPWSNFLIGTDSGALSAADLSMRTVTAAAQGRKSERFSRHIVTSSDPYSAGRCEWGN